MIVTDEDLLILKWFLKLSNGETELWEIMKKIYPKGRTTEYMRVKQKLKKFKDYGLMIQDEEGYKLISDNVILKKIQFNGKPTDSICIFTNGSWCAFEL